MKQQEFLDELDDTKIAAAIREAEQSTSGEIRVFISSRRLGRDRVTDRAAARFERMRMTRTAERNGVLIYVMPLERQFAVIGDRGIHEKCGEAFWSGIAAGVAACFKEHRYTDGVVLAIRQAGEALASHFPRRPDDRDELPNEVLRD